MTSYTYFVILMYEQECLFVNCCSSKKFKWSTLHLQMKFIIIFSRAVSYIIYRWAYISIVTGAQVNVSYNRLIPAWACLPLTMQFNPLDNPIITKCIFFCAHRFCCQSFWIVCVSFVSICKRIYLCMRYLSFKCCTRATSRHDGIGGVSFHSVLHLTFEFWNVRLRLGSHYTYRITGPQ